MIGHVIGRCADAFGTKTAIVAALVWALLPVVPALAGAQPFILYVSAGVVQLVALPLLAWQGRQNTRAVEHHADHLLRVHASLDALHKHLGTGHGQAPQA